MTKDQSAPPRSGCGESGRSPGQSARDAPRDLASEDAPRDLASEAVSRAVDVAQDAATGGKQAAASLTSELREEAKGLMHQQLGAGADLTNHIAESVRTAADTLGAKSPLLAE